MNHAVKPLLGILFSKDRPLQLDAALRSLRLHCRDAGEASLKVLYAASDADQESLYEQLAREHPTVGFVREQDFKPDLLRLLGPAELVLFLVDDTLFVRDFALGDIREVLEADPSVLGFSLRLGRNTTYCYSFDKPQALPPFTSARPGVVQYAWADAQWDFGYPLEISSSVYRTRDVLPLIRELKFTNPNTLEHGLCQCAERFRPGLGCLLCYEQSVAFSAPVNRVQTVSENRAGGQSAYAANQLARYYAWGKRIEVGAYVEFTPNACHQEVPLHLTEFTPQVPVVSVVIPCFQQAQFLPEAVESVVAQTFLGWEIVIVNDGSPDDTGAVAKDLFGRYPSRRLRLIEQENRGLAAARNAAIRAATGRYVLPLDADDRLAPALLHKALAWLEAHPETAIVYTDMACFGASQHTVSMAPYDFDRLCGNNLLPYCALYRREAWEQVGGYRTDMVHPGYEDWDFWIGCGARGFLAYRLPEPLFHYRIRDASMITRALDHDLVLRADIVRHHPSLYSDTTQRWAQALLSGQPPAPEELAGLPHEILARTERCEQWRKEAQRLAQDWNRHRGLIHDLEQHRDRLQRENDRLRALIRRNPAVRLARAFRRLKGQLGLGPK